MKDVKPLKVMYLIDYFYGTSGGTERQLYELIRNLDYQRCMPFLTVMRHTSYLEAHNFPCAVDVLGINSILQPSTLAKFIRFALRIKDLGIDVVHIFFNDSAIAAPLFSKLGGAKVVSSRRDMGFWYTPAKLVALRFSNLFVDAIVANCKAVQSNVSTVERFPIDRIHVIYNGHDEKRYLNSQDEGLHEPLHIGEDESVIGMVGNLYEVKRPQDILAAFKIIQAVHPRAHLVFVGGGELEIERVTHQAQGIGLEKNIHFIGRVPDPVSFIKHFDVCVLCSESEGLSNTIIEYMGCGKATVCTDAGGNVELIRDGYNGFVVPVGAREAMAERILQLIEDRELRCRLGMNARAVSAEERFSLSCLADSHYELYRRLAGDDHALLCTSGRSI